MDNREDSATLIQASCGFLCAAPSAETFCFVPALFGHERASRNEIHTGLNGPLMQRAAGCWFKVRQGNLSGRLSPGKTWRETLVTHSVTSQRLVSLQTICPASEGFRNMEGRQAHWGDCRRARALWSSVFQDQSSAAQQGNVWGHGQWDEGGGRRRRTGDSEPHGVTVRS